MSVDDVQVIAPIYRGPVGVDALNLALKEALNPADGRRGIAGFHEGDRVMQTRNDADLDVSNGDIGRVVDLDHAGRKLRVAFPRGEVTYDKDQARDLTPAWAITVHKSQGGEWPVIVLVCDRSHRVMLWRNLVYTAVTRAQRALVIVGQSEALRDAARHDRPRNRQTALAWRLEDLAGPGGGRDADDAGSTTDSAGDPERPPDRPPRGADVSDDTVSDDTTVRLYRRLPETPDADWWAGLAGGSPDGRVLYVGCGTGRLALPVARKATALVGVDHDAAMLAAFRERLDREPDLAERIRLVEADASTLNLGDRFGLVVLPSNLLNGDHRSVGADLGRPAGGPALRPRRGRGPAGAEPVLDGVSGPDRERPHRAARRWPGHRRHDRAGGLRRVGAASAGPHRVPLRRRRDAGGRARRGRVVPAGAARPGVPGRARDRLDLRRRAGHQRAGCRPGAAGTWCVAPPDPARPQGAAGRPPSIGASVVSGITAASGTIAHACPNRPM